MVTLFEAVGLVFSFGFYFWLFKTYSKKVVDGEEQSVTLLDFLIFLIQVMIVGSLFLYLWPLPVHLYK